MGSVEPPAAFCRDRPILIETLRPTFAARYAGLGLDFATQAFAGSNDVARRVQEALRRLATVPSLAAVLGNLLEVIHVVSPEGPDFDVSYSDPDVPFSVFVGIGADEDIMSELRIAEGLLHECMHLQLTQIERVMPLVAMGEMRLHSPWQKTRRPVQGVMHGTYVFAVIRDFMIEVRDGGLLDADESRHVADRIATSTNEIAAATEALIGVADLTPAGRDLVARIATRPVTGARTASPT